MQNKIIILLKKNKLVIKNKYIIINLYIYINKNEIDVEKKNNNF